MSQHDLSSLAQKSQENAISTSSILMRKDAESVEKVASAFFLSKMASPSLESQRRWKKAERCCLHTTSIHAVPREFLFVSLVY